LAQGFQLRHLAGLYGGSPEAGGEWSGKRDARRPFRARSALLKVNQPAARRLLDTARDGRDVEILEQG